MKANSKVIAIYFDGACQPNPGEMGIGVYCKLPSGSVHIDSVAAGHGTNNLAEWLALEHAMRVATYHHKYYPLCQIVIYGDSNLVVQQINGAWKIRDEKLLKVYRRVCDLWDKIVPVAPENPEDENLPVLFKWIPRNKNGQADALAKKALQRRLNDA